MIKAENIVKKFGDLEVLKSVSLNISEREIVSIVGASGAGKTTLLQILGTLEKSTEPRKYNTNISIAGQDITKLNDRDLSKFRNENIGFIFQFHQLLPEFNALENICIPAFIKKTKKAEAENRAKELMSYLGLTNRLTHKPNQLSGGEQQRVAVARALINQPKVVFADEPSGNLDSKNAEELHELFFNLRNEFGQTFVIVTHNEELANMTDRKLVMADGLFETNAQ
ncbi:lipoprotein-releasing system ATP-binding protein [Algoriella xinjiangensis]|uniref:Lipoprotein-releasing system ATP-binding protein n=1 Tax=Algoriella xinjiangensis TaxID=684065 RepID=A0A1I4VGE0_9FLAO|nr:ABC transporter ATP-binding protein [Algoriella xinjiangensis]SFN00267.1 lipoprotein-releasing system ATP-binding protein [Algoriella xinjiangensis]VDH17157.1 Lipoprotein-releasing system ATP-binding protein LolD [Algoriella xinjiangensis]